MGRLPPAEKLPLAVRKSLRDDYESKKGEMEKKLSELLGEAWTISINPNAIYPYAAPDSYADRNLGSCLTDYVENAISRLGQFKDENGKDGVADLNEICSAHVLTMDFDEAKANRCCGVDVFEGKLRILFAEGNLAVNIYDCLELQKLRDALNSAPAPGGPGLSFAAKASIRNDYDPEIENIRKRIAGIIKKDDIKLNPNWESCFTALKAARDGGNKDLREDWETQLGSMHKLYFEGVVSQLDWQKFGEDEMLQEGLNEAVEKGEIAFRIVDKLGGGYNECVIEDGIMYLQTTPSNYAVNITECARNLVDLL